jgi:hypothetical protein
MNLDPRRIASPIRESLLSKFLNIPKQVSVKEGYNWLTPLMNKALEKGQPLWDSPRTYFRASSAGEECIRALTYDLMGHRVPFEARTLRIFNTGNAIEDTIIDAMQKAKVLVQDQIRIEYLSPPIKGRADVIVSNPATDEKYLGEIKSINQYAFTKLNDSAKPVLAGESDLISYQRKYVVQWNLYAWSKEIKLETGFIIFEAKNTQEEKVIWLMRDKELLDITILNLNKALEYSAKSIIAPRTKEFDPKKPRSKCGWCVRRYLCKKMTLDSYTYKEVLELDKKLRGI